MNPNREEALFQLALEKPAEKRAAWLDAECEGDSDLRARIEALLAAHEQTEGALAEPSPAAKATMKIEFTEVPDETIGQKIGRYKILEKVGEGGCGVVYVAEQTEPVRRRVALKVIKLGMDTKQVVARFEAERQALAMMDHPNIARVLDAGTTDTGRPYFIMELVRGIKITDYCDQNHLPTEERLNLFIKVCQAIQHAHQKGIIHRDIKPSNILVTLHDGVPVPKVIDFGIAKATEGRLTDATVYTQLHQFIGTPAYMSPEQAEMSGLDVDTRSDVYSLGVLLYELLTGKTPFDGQELMSLGIDAMRKTIREKDPVRPSTKLATLQGDELTTTAKRRSVEVPKLIHLLKGDLDWIVMKCLEKDRTRRYETANGLAVDIKRHLNMEPVVARPPSRLYEFQKTVRRHKVGFAATAAIIVVLAVGVTMTTWQAVRATHAKQEALAAQASEKVQRQQAVANEQKAVQAQSNEQHLRKQAQLEAYAADMKAAQAALQQNSRQQAVTLLNHYWPKPGEPDLRGVEWRYLWQAAKGDQIYTWKLPNMVMGAHFSPEGREIATACSDGILRIFNVASGKLVGQFDRGVSDEHVEISFCYAPDGSTLATATRDGIVLLDCAIWQAKRTVPLPESEHAALGVMSLTYSPDGRWLAAEENYQSTRIWNTASWDSFTLPVATEGRIVFSPDSKTLAVCKAGDIELWDVATRSIRVTLHKPPAIPDGKNEGWFLTRFSPKGDRLLATCYLGYVAMWDLHSGQAVWFEQAHRSLVYGLAFSHDGKHFASGGFDQLIHIWDTATQKEVMTLKGHLNEIWSLEFSPDDRYLLTSSKDGTVMLWNAETKPKPDYWMLDTGETPVGFTLDGRGLFSISGDGTTLRRWDGPQVIKSLPLPTPLLQAQTVFSPGSQSLYALDTNSNSDVQVFDANTLKLKRSVKLSPPAASIYRISPNERLLLGSDPTSRDICVWDVASGEAIAHLTGVTSRSQFSPDSRVLAFATDKWEVKLWDITKRQLLSTVEAHPWIVYSVCFSPDNRYVASSSWAGDIHISEVATGKEVMPPLYGGGSGVNSLCFSSDGATLVSSADDYSVRLWNVATGREMLLFASGNNQYARIPFLSPTGELLVYPDFKQNSRVRVTSIPTLAEIEKAHAAESTAP